MWRKIALIFLAANIFFVLNASATNSYTDSETKIKFDIPAGWSEASMPSDKDYSDYFDTRFIYSNDESEIIIFGSSDIWSEMSASERRGLTRAQMETNSFSEEDASYFMGDVDYTKAFYNNRTYYRLISTEQRTFGSLTITVYSEIYEYIDYGYAFIFGYCWTDLVGRTRFSDFEALLNSVDYSYMDRLSAQEAGQEITFSKVVNSKMFDANIGFYLMYFFSGAVVYNWAIVIFGIIALLRARKGNSPVGMFVWGTIVTLIPWLGNIYNWTQDPVLLSRTLDIQIINVLFFVVFVSITLPIAIKIANKNKVAVECKQSVQQEFIQYASKDESKQVSRVASNSATVDTAFHSNANQQVEMMQTPRIKFCNKCGAKLPDNSLYCANCGSRIPEII